MKFQKLLVGVRFFTVLSLGAFVSVLFFVDPDVSGAPGVALFLGTLFCGLSGVFTLLLVFFARRFIGEAGASASFHTLFRQGFIFSAYAVSMLGLSRFGLFVWWNALLGLAVALLVEFTARRSSNPAAG